MPLEKKGDTLIFLQTAKSSSQQTDGWQILFMPCLDSSRRGVERPTPKSFGNPSAQLIKRVMKCPLKLVTVIGPDN